MNPHVHKALDGEMDAQSLTAPERAELADAESQIDAVLRALPIEALPDLAPAVLERVRREPARARNQIERAPAKATRWRGAADWIWRPRAIAMTWRPAYALVAAALCFAVYLGVARRTQPNVAAGAPQQVLMQFVLKAPDAKNVAVAGDFSGWKPVHVMTKSGGGVWTVVVPLDPGVHDYAFVVDGERWVPDPAAPPVNDGFGGVNSRVAVLSLGGGRS